MQTRKSFIFWVLTFVILNLYVNLPPRLFQEENVTHWILYWLSFFVIAFLVARYMLRLPGLQSFGMHLHSGWFQNLIMGFMVGAGVYAFKYLLFYRFGMFELVGTRDVSFISVLIAQALLAMFFSSAISNVLIRGYWLPYLRKERLMKWYLLVASLLYIVDDAWNESLQVENMVFSAVLGVTFAYTVLKTGNIWMSVGLHWGGNVLYRTVYGFSGQGIWRLENLTDGPLFDYISFAVTGLMFPVVYLLLKRNLIQVDKQAEITDKPLSAILS